MRWRWGFNGKAESERGTLECERDLCVKERTCWMVCMEHVSEKVCADGRHGCVLYKSVCVCETDSRRVRLFIHLKTPNKELWTLLSIHPVYI